jgi:undecaprenyl-diphosphatase
MGYKDVAEIFTVVIQTGAIAAIVWHYRQDLLKRTAGLLQREKSSLAFWRNWVIATIPAGIAGLLFESSLSDFQTAGVALMFIIGGLLILAVEELHRPRPAAKEVHIEKLTVKQSVQVGLYQILALVPGVSRSGATIMGGLLSGLDRVTATAFSFYLSLPILILAGGYKLVKHHELVGQVAGGSTAIILGSIAAFITALAAVNWLLKYVAHHDFKPFAYYRLALGIAILVVLGLR